MGMKNKMAKIASVAAMMAVANGDEVYDFNQSSTPKNTLSKGEKKKCKSCACYDKNLPRACREKRPGWFVVPAPMDIACEHYKRRKKK